MKKIKLELENCYGIKKFTAEIDFTKKNANIIYAPNGAMKTSLALTFKDLSEGKDSLDRIYKDRITKRTIVDDSNNGIRPEQVFVIEPYAPAYESSKISTLLVNKELKKEYDSILQAIDEKKELILKELKKISGMKNGIEEAISEVFTKEKDKFYVALGRIEKEVLEEQKSDLSKIAYGQIFNDKVEAFLNTKDFKTKLVEYTKIYDKLLSSSTFFKKGVFNHFQASEITKNLKNHGFFKADHSVYLNSSSEKKEIKSEQELEGIINKEKESILTNPDLQKTFNEIDSKLTTQDLRAFREYLLNNQLILPELANLELFKEKMWKAYFVEFKELFKNCMDEYNKGKARIQEILDSASKQATRWQDVINIFNRRFSVPFKVSIENKQDVILKSVTPNIKFEFFDDSGIAAPVERSELLTVLSNGEKRALYILNIIFEVEARKETKTKTLFIVDDIADSFDYKNKYAIIEYLHDMLDEDVFYQIILTHNYDFYRTVNGRLELGGAKFHIIKTKEAISLEEDKMYKEPFNKWKDLINDSDKREFLVAMIPFVRNLAEYCGRAEDESKLTSLLHIKKDTNAITVKSLFTLINGILNRNDDVTHPDQNALAKDVIFLVADQISKDTAISVELEKKIALSIAIRLKAEEYLIKKISDDAFVENINKNQTAKLIREYKKKHLNTSSEAAAIKIIERVNLMTPENIHLNSFMYEPILDLSNEHLKQLYADVSGLE